MLPGGGIRSCELPAEAARREVREESGIRLASLPDLLGSYRVRGVFRWHTVMLFSAKASADVDRWSDWLEIREAAFFQLHDLPPDLYPSSQKRLREFLQDYGADNDNW
jgi:8-oxo-dGTP pyrophosphatase MutT (NUDIX family)